MIGQPDGGHGGHTADSAERARLVAGHPGPSAAGKTTVGHEIGARLDRAIHVDGDFIQRLIISGSITMDLPPPPGAMEQLDQRFQAALTMTRAAGFDAIITDNLFEDSARGSIAAAKASLKRRLTSCYISISPTLRAPL